MKTIALLPFAISKVMRRNCLQANGWFAFNCSLFLLTWSATKKNSLLVINISDMPVFVCIAHFCSLHTKAFDSIITHYDVQCTILPRRNDDCDLCCVYVFFSQSHTFIFKLSQMVAQPRGNEWAWAWAYRCCIAFICDFYL